MRITQKLILTFLLFFVNVVATFAGCYDETIKAGKAAFNSGKYSFARQCFMSAKQCPDAPANANSICNEWIRKIEVRLTPSSSADNAEIYYKKDLEKGEQLFDAEQYADAKKHFAKMLAKYPKHKDDISHWIDACNTMLTNQDTVVQTTSISQQSSSEADINTDVSEDTVFEFSEELPRFPGGESALLRFIAEHLQYPTVALENNIQGRVNIRFVVEKDGSIGNVEVQRGVDINLDNEAIRVVKSMPKWLPGKQNGMPVRCYFTIPINFKIQGNSEINGHEYVDLGLSVKWATCNIGASSSEEYGDHFSWGEISKYDDGKCKTMEVYMSDITGNSSYDIARASWGSSWRLPTKAEFDELIDNCNWTWISQGGHNGYKVTSKKNGNSIFLPASGCWLDSTLDGVDIYGAYWSSTPDYSDDHYWYANHLSFDNATITMEIYYRNWGFSVRAVSE